MCKRDARYIFLVSDTVSNINFSLNVSLLCQSVSVIFSYYYVEKDSIRHRFLCVFFCDSVKFVTMFLSVKLAPVLSFFLTLQSLLLTSHTISPTFITEDFLSFVSHIKKH